MASTEPTTTTATVPEAVSTLTLYRERLFILADDWPGRGTQRLTRELALHQVINRVASAMENALGKAPTFFEDFDGTGGGSRLPLTPDGMRLWLSLASGEGNSIMLPRLLCIGNASKKRAAMYSARLHIEWTAHRHWRMVPSVALLEHTHWSVARKERQLSFKYMDPAITAAAGDAYDEDEENPVVHLYLSNCVRVRALTREEASAVLSQARHSEFIHADLVGGAASDDGEDRPGETRREGFLAALGGGPGRFATYLSWRIPKAIEALSKALEDDDDEAMSKLPLPPRIPHPGSSLLEPHPYF